MDEPKIDEQAIRMWAVEQASKLGSGAPGTVAKAEQLVKAARELERYVLGE